VEHGLYSPARIRAAGLDRLRAVLADDAARAEAVLAGAETWLSARAAEEDAAAAAAARADEGIPVEPGSVEDAGR
jgi:hypothetical protein